MMVPLSAGVEPAVLNGGAVLCHLEWSVPLVSKVLARLLILDVSRPVLRGQQVTMHLKGLRSAHMQRMPTAHRACPVHTEHPQCTQSGIPSRQTCDS